MQNLTNLFGDLGISGLRVLGWTTLSFVLGFALGYLCHCFRNLRIALLPLVNFMRHVSPFCWLPLIILIVGIGEWPVGMVLLFSMLFNAILISMGIFENIPREISDTASLDGVQAWSMFKDIELPIAIPELINMYRVLWSVGWTAIIAAEMLGVKCGLGYRLLDFRYLLQYREMFIYIAVIGGIGIATDYLLVALHKSVKRIQQS